MEASKENEWNLIVRGECATEKAVTDSPMVHVTREKNDYRYAYVSCWLQLEPQKGNPFTAEMSQGEIHNEHITNIGHTNDTSLHGTKISFSYEIEDGLDKYYLWTFSYRYKKSLGTGVLQVLMIGKKGIGEETPRGTVTTADDGVSDPGK